MSIQKKILLILSLSFLSLGGLFLIRSIESLMIARASIDWLETPGLIVSSHLASVSVHKYQIRVTYTYNINGIEYSGDRYSFYERLMRKKEADKEIKKYTIGSRVKIYYDSSKPSTSVVVREVGLDDLLDLLLPILFFLLGIVLLVIFFRWVEIGI